VRQIVGVVAVVLRCASDDGYMVLMGSRRSRAARLVRQVVLEVSAGSGGRVMLMIVHASPSWGRSVQYERVGAVVDNSSDEFALRNRDVPTSGSARKASSAPRRVRE